jgi:imidazolonepropionase-like amidohydrolase
VAETLWVRGGLVCDGDAAPRRADVLVEGDTIAAVLEPPPEAVAGARPVDADGRLVTPGLADVHTHLLLSGDVMSPMAYERELLKDSLPLRTLRAAAHARLMLDHGVTTVRDVCTEGAGYADVALRDAIVAGLVEGPRVHPSGPGIGITGGYMPGGIAPGVCVPSGCELADGVDAARAAVRRQVAGGASWIKVFADWPVADPRGGPRRPRPTFTPDELAAICDEARRRDRRVAAHVTSDDGARQAILAGAASLEHVADFTRPTLDLAAERGVFLVPTLAVSRHLCDALAPESPKRAARLESWEAGCAGFLLARQAGVRIAAGTDIGCYPHALGSLLELGAYLALGVPPLEVLRAATQAPADLLGVDGGRVRAGAPADLCVWPAADIAAALAARPLRVIARGRLVRG